MYATCTWSLFLDIYFVAGRSSPAVLSYPTVCYFILFRSDFLDPMTGKMVLDYSKFDNIEDSDEALLAVSAEVILVTLKLKYSIPSPA